MSQNPPNHKRKASSHLESVADVLQTLLQDVKSPVSDGFKRWRLEKDWASIVGPSIGAATAPADYRDGVLFVWTRSSAWIQQLHFVRDEIRDKVNTHLGKKWVTRVNFTLDRKALTQNPTAP